MACSACGRWVLLVAVEQGARQQLEPESCTKLCVQSVDDDNLLTCKVEGQSRRTGTNGNTMYQSRRADCKHCVQGIYCRHGGAGASVPPPLCVI